VYGQAAAHIGPGDSPYNGGTYGGLVSVGTNGVALLFNMNLTATTANSQTNNVLREGAFASQTDLDDAKVNAEGAYAGYFKIDPAVQPSDGPTAGDMYAHVKLGNGVVLGATGPSNSEGADNWMLIQDGNPNIYDDSTHTNYVQMTQTDMRIKYGAQANANIIHIFSKKAATPGGGGNGASAVSYAASGKLNTGITGDKYLVLTTGGQFAGNIDAGNATDFKIVQKENANTTVGIAKKMKNFNAYLKLDNSYTFTNTNPVYVFAKRAAISSGDITAVVSYVGGTSFIPVVDDLYIYVQATNGFNATSLDKTKWAVYQEGGASGENTSINDAVKLMSTSSQAGATTKAALTLYNKSLSTNQMYLFAKKGEVLDEITSAVGYFVYKKADGVASITASSNGIKITFNSNYYIKTGLTDAIFITPVGYTSTFWVATGSYSLTGYILKKTHTGTAGIAANVIHYLFLKKSSFDALPPSPSGSSAIGSIELNGTM
jgi:hypothetical protein